MNNDNGRDCNNKIIDVIIPNYNGIKFIENCLLSISKQTLLNFEVIVVDNHSTDGSDVIIEERFPWVRLIRLKKNYGFARAVNIGIRNSSSEYVVLLNNDTVVNKNFIENLYKAIDNKKDVFSYQAKMVKLYDKERIDSAGDQYCILGWAFCRGKDKPVSDYTKDEEIFSSCAGAAIYRRSILGEIGLFDESHFCYLEDVDLGYRARLYGYRNRFCPDAVVYHAGSATTGSRHNPFKVRISSGNNIFLIYKNMPLWQICINFPFLCAGHLIKLAYFIRKGFGKEYLQGIGRGFRLCRKYKGARVSAKNPLEYLRIQADLMMALRLL